MQTIRAHIGPVGLEAQPCLVSSMQEENHRSDSWHPNVNVGWPEPVNLESKVTHMKGELL